MRTRFTRENVELVHATLSPLVLWFLYWLRWVR